MGGSRRRCGGAGRPRLRGGRLRRLASAASMAAAIGVLLVPFAQGTGTAGAATVPAPKAAGGANTNFQFSAEPYAAPGSQQRSYLAYELQPGHHLLDQVVILNKSAAPESFLVYPEDATNIPGTGGFGYQSRAKMHNTAIGLWVTVGNGSLTVPPGKEVVVTFELAVPADATPGDHVGAVVVEELHSPGQQHSRFGLTEVLRIAVPMYLHVVGPVHPGLTIESVKVIHQSPIFPYLQSTKVAVQVELVNTGDDIVDPKSVAMSITGLIGGTVHSYTVHQTGAAQSKSNPLPIQMLPGARLSLTELWSGVPPFDPLTVHVAAKGIDPTTGLAVTTAGSKLFWYFPWLLVLIVVILVVLYVLWRRRRRARLEGQANQGSGPVASGSAVPSPRPVPGGTPAGTPVPRSPQPVPGGAPGAGALRTGT